MSAVIVNYFERKPYFHNQMFVFIIFAVFALLTSSPLIQSQSTTSSTMTSITPSTPYEYHYHHQPRSSLRDLFFSGLFLMRPSLIKSQIEPMDIKAVSEIDSNEFPAAEPITTTASPLPSPPSASIYSRFRALQDRLSLDKAILPPIPLLSQVSSDQVVKKINFISPRMVDTIPEIVMTD